MSETERFEIPQNWVWTTISEIAHIEREHIDPRERPNEAFNYLSIENIKPQTGELINFRPTTGKDIGSTKIKFTTKDVLYSKLRPYLNKVHIPSFDGISATDLIPIRPEHGVKREYLAYYLRMQRTVERLNGRVHGIQLPRVSIDDILSTPIPLPPENEQSRIISKIDNLFPEAKSAKRTAEEIPVLLSKLKQSLFDSASDGRLTSDWRKMNPAIYPASKIFQENSIPIIDSKIFSDDLPTIPDSWVWTQLKHISNIRGGITKGKKYGTKKTIRIPYLRVANVQDGYLDLSEIKTIEALPEDQEKYRLRKGDILFNEGGDRDKLGRGCVWNEEIPDCIHQNHVFRVRMITSAILPEYISIFSKSKFAREYFYESASQTVNLASMNMTALGNLPVAIPPTDEQKMIMNQITHSSGLIGQIERDCVHAKNSIDIIFQSIFSKAFSGELVQQDPNDEPASVLLERIKSKDRKKV